MLDEGKKVLIEVYLICIEHNNFDITLFNFKRRQAIPTINLKFVTLKNFLICTNGACPLSLHVEWRYPGDVGDCHGGGDEAVVVVDGGNAGFELVPAGVETTTQR